jgi:hypothetical protein
MSDQIFFDVPVSTQFSNGVVKLGVAEFSGPEKDGKQSIGNQKMILTTLPGLLQFQAQINQLVNELVQRNVLKKNDMAGSDSNPSAKSKPKSDDLIV